jgi:TatA/E family protein of Tat protein translocase
MFGFQEWLVLAAIVVLFVGARRLPDLARAIGRTSKSFRDGLANRDEERPVREVRGVEDDRNRRES